ncbi:MAG: hypothetical protein U9M95_06620 [Candidatus Altiarchaeota archaeon]|nr:hypothetical protein [Candidatus Altiarchaeota archaeon]
MDSKKIMVYLIGLSLLATPLVLAEKGGNSANKSMTPPGLEKQGKKLGGDSNPAVNKAGGKPDDAGSQSMSNSGVRHAKVVLAKVKNKTALKKQQLELELQNISNRDKLKVFRNQNTVREAVMTMLALKKEGNFSGGIGKNISAIARNFSNSVNKTIQAEQRIMERQGFMRMLFGGDENAAGTIQSQLNRNRVTLQKLQHLEGEIDPEYRNLLQNQTQLIQQEQERLRQVAQQELGDKGLLGWLFK